MTLPNFLIIGAAKSGTTSLYKYLEQHPQIYMSAFKEPGFFAFEGETLNFQGPGTRYRINKWTVTDLKTYQEMFAGVTTEKAIGEATPLYLYFPKACDRIKHYIPDAKLIAMLRNPVERAFSNYVWAVQPGAEPLTDFAQALQAEPERIKNNWGPRWRYKDQGFYYAQLKPYFEAFHRDQIRVYLTEDFTANPVALVQDMFQFLEVDPSFTPNTSRKHNQSRIPRNQSWHQFLSQPNPVKSLLKPLLPVEFRQRVQTRLKEKNLHKPTLSPEIRQQLLADYREDILNLQQLLQRDLSQWLEM